MTKPLTGKTGPMTGESTISSDLLKRHYQTLVDDNAQWQTLIADDILWELAYAPATKRASPPSISVIS